MAIKAETLGDKARLVISDPFDSRSYKDFKNAYLPLMNDKAVQAIEVDISTVEYLDSGALGMLFLLNETAKNEGKIVTLISVPGRVADILKMAHVDQLFSIFLPSGMKLDMQRK